MFERFTDRARHVVVLAQGEARMLGHDYIGTEHLLLGLLHEGEGVAAMALEALGVSSDAARARVEEMVGRGETAPTGNIPFTPRAKKVLEMSLREARRMGQDHIGTEHILLGLLREGEGVGAKVLVELGADLGRVRQQVIEVVAGGTGDPPATSAAAVRIPAPGGWMAQPIPARGPGDPEPGPRCPDCGADLLEAARARAARVPDQGGEGSHAVIWLLCGQCGRVLAAKLPD